MLALMPDGRSFKAALIEKIDIVRMPEPQPLAPAYPQVLDFGNGLRGVDHLPEVKVVQLGALPPLPDTAERPRGEWVVQAHLVDGRVEILGWFQGTNQGYEQAKDYATACHHAVNAALLKAR